MPNLKGSLVAIVTPMLPDGALDFPRLEALVNWHIAEGTNGIVIVGTTGESPTVDFEEHNSLIKACVKYAAKRVPVIAGTGANSTTEAILLTQYAQAAGADYGLSVVPYYNKPTQQGMYLHYRKIAEACDLPMILYNVPGRTIADMSNDTVLKLTEVPNIIGIKDATGDMARGANLLARAPKDFVVLSGDDATTVPLMALGAQGTISVTANVAPGLMSKMCAAMLAGDIANAIAINKLLQGLHQNLFLESNPIPAKWALVQMGKIASGIRLPLTALDAKYHDAVKAAMLQANISI
jgi:4-hydroxy-tetrahydrodipicolinate synthase